MKPVRVYVVFTSIDETIAAATIASALARAMSVPLTLVHFQTVHHAAEPDAPDVCSPLQTDHFRERLRFAGVDATIRVYLCRDPRAVFGLAFREGSLIVIGGRRRWWPTRAESLRRELERNGHLVVFVDEARHAA